MHLTNLFNYSQLVWMSNIKSLNNKINEIWERVLRKFCDYLNPVLQIYQNQFIWHIPPKKRQYLEIEIHKMKL